MNIHISRKPLVILSICLLFAFSWCGIAQAQVTAQDIDQATREVDHSLREEAEEILTPPLEEPPAIEETIPLKEGSGTKFNIKKRLL